MNMNLQQESLRPWSESNSVIRRHLTWQDWCTGRAAAETVSMSVRYMTVRSAVWKGSLGCMETGRISHNGHRYREQMLWKDADLQSRKTRQKRRESSEHSAGPTASLRQWRSSFRECMSLRSWRADTLTQAVLPLAVLSFMTATYSYTATMQQTHVPDYWSMRLTWSGCINSETWTRRRKKERRTVNCRPLLPWQSLQATIKRYPHCSQRKHLKRHRIPMNR